MYRKTPIFTVALLALTASLSAPAQPFGGPRGPMAFGAMDLDGNGYVSSEEFHQHRGERMATRAGEGRLLRNAGEAPRFESWDTNGDGKLSRTEVATGQQERIAERSAAGRPCCGNR